MLWNIIIVFIQYYIISGFNNIDDLRIEFKRKLFYADPFSSVYIIVVLLVCRTLFDEQFIFNGNAEIIFLFFGKIFNLCIPFYNAPTECKDLVRYIKKRSAVRITPSMEKALHKRCVCFIYRTII